MANEYVEFEAQVNLEETAAWDGAERPLLPIGDYQLTVVNVQQKPSKNGTMMEVTFEVADEGEHKGSKVWCNYQLQGNGVGRLKQFAIACGAPLNTVRSDFYMGCTILASIQHNEGAARVDQAGNPLPIKTFANVWNERPLSQPEVQSAPAQQPPITKTKANGQGQVRRA